MDHVTLSISIDTPDVRVLLRALADALGTQECTQSIKAETMQSEVQTETSGTTPIENSDEMKQDYEGMLAKADAKISELRKEKEESERKLKDQIQKLERRISVYEPYISGGDSEEMFFNAEGKFLRRTLCDDAPYIATKLSNGKASFMFNVFHGPTKEACKKKEEMLTPFCEIDEEQDSATEIRMVKPGEGVLSHDGQITVITRAIVKLIKQ